MPFRDVVSDPCRPVVIYTAVPPPRGASPSRVGAALNRLDWLLTGTSVDALHVPEVRDDPRTPRKSFVPKMAPRAFGRWIQRHLGAPAIVDRGVAHTHWVNQRRWLRKTLRDDRIENLVLVGAASGRAPHPGPSVPEAARLISRDSELDVFLGGITIPTRRRRDPARDEPARLIEKGQSGVEFFISQIMVEAERAKRLLSDYHGRCAEVGARPKRVFLSFAPVSSREDVQFFNSWGIEIPAEHERRLLGGRPGTVRRSVLLAGEVLEELLDFARGEVAGVPLGLNVEHVRARNFEVSRELLWHLTEVYRRRYQFV